MRKKINIYLAVIGGISILMTAILTMLVYYNLYQKQVISDLKTYSVILIAGGYLKEAKEVLPIEEIRITWIDKEGSVLYESNAKKEEMDNHRKRPEIVQAFDMGEGQAVRRSNTLGKNAYYYAVKMKDNSVLRISKEASSFYSVFGSAIPILFLSGFVLMILCLFLARWLTLRMIKPIEAMALNMTEIEERVAYEELRPFAKTIKKQHEDIINNVKQNEKMRRDFTANVSHELKTPLTSISGYAELIEQGMAKPDDVSRFAAEIHKNANRLLSLINDIIKLSELDEKDKENNFVILDVYEIAKDCIETLQFSASNRMVTLKLTGEEVLIRGDKSMIEELIYNLCDNAIRYNKPNGSVLVVIKYENSRPKLIVSDTGIGISKEHQEHIFERFYRVDKSRSKETGGTGLGLAIVKHIVEYHRAKLQLKSKEMEGTEIIIEFE